jgi:NADPH:quinone reductase-like Zn-dependent oxidoreductase
MRAVVFEEHGGPEVLQYKEIPDPVPGPGQVLLEIRAAAANFNDIWARRGEPESMTYTLPHVSGSDAAGVVRSVGEGVRTVEAGSEVLIHPGQSCRVCAACTDGEEFFCRQFKIWGFQTGPVEGSHAELAVVQEAQVVPKPPNLSFEEASSLALVLETAWRMLMRRARIRAGDRVLIWGGAGGLGTMAIQICRVAGAEPIPVVGSADKVEVCRALGAEHVIDRSTNEIASEIKRVTGGRGVDVVFEHTGQETWPTSVRVLRRGGTIVTCGATSGYAATTDIRFLWNKQQNHLGSHLASRAELEEALAFVASGAIKPVVGEVMPLREVGKGQELMESRQLTGKIVYVPES